ncbi:hypothetical protein [Shewanella aquimarina]|nr:hypothetical protein [Shewanella aquimarina]MCL2912094.1 hypothetical protein [Shewanella aquimarina]
MMKIKFTFLCVFLFPLSAIGAADSEIEQLENRVHALKIKAERAQAEYLNAKSELERLQKSKATNKKTGDEKSDTPPTSVFNNKRMWNPEKIFWENKFFKCGNYLADGRCEYVVEMKNVRITLDKD